MADMTDEHSLAPEKLGQHFLIMMPLKLHHLGQRMAWMTNDVPEDQSLLHFFRSFFGCNSPRLFANEPV